jgi:hypothetical protein
MSREQRWPSHVELRKFKPASASRRELVADSVKGETRSRGNRCTPRGLEGRISLGRGDFGRARPQALVHARRPGHRRRAPETHRCGPGPSGTAPQIATIRSGKARQKWSLRHTLSSWSWVLLPVNQLTTKPHFSWKNTKREGELSLPFSKPFFLPHQHRPTYRSLVHRTISAESPRF